MQPGFEIASTCFHYGRCNRHFLASLGHLFPTDVVSPELWEQLARWIPARGSLERAEWLAAEQAARLRHWLDSIVARP